MIELELYEQHKDSQGLGKGKWRSKKAEQISRLCNGQDHHQCIKKSTGLMSENSFWMFSTSSVA